MNVLRQGLTKLPRLGLNLVILPPPPPGGLGLKVYTTMSRLQGFLSLKNESSRK